MSVKNNRADNQTDAELLDLIRQDDRTAFELVYDRYWSKLYISAYKILRNRQGSEDIVQEVLVQLWLKRYTQQIESLNAYLYTAIRFQVFKTIRDGKVRESLFSEIEESKIDVHAADDFLSFDIDRKLNESLAELPDKCREIFSLSRKEQLSTKEIALRLGISTKTVENQMTIAIRKLKASMGEVFFWLAVFMVYLWEK